MSILDYFPGEPRDVQRDILLELEANYDSNDVLVINAPVACHDPNQLVLKHDGTLVKIGDVQVGDKLLGPDGQPRTVLERHEGIQEMVEVQPHRSAPFVVSKTHILNLHRCIRTGGRTNRANKFIKENISVSDYINKSNDYKNNSWLWRAGQEYTTKQVSIPPYILGVWLGDGTSRETSITSMDPEIIAEWADYCRSLGMDITSQSVIGSKAEYVRASTKRGKQNPLLHKLRKLKLYNNKHIPHNYLTSSKEQRMELLAGLIDTDGHVSHGGTSVEITQSRELLIDDILQLVWSLGYSATKLTKVINGVTYYRIHISGIDIELVRPRLSYKQLKNSKSNQSNRKFTIREIGLGKYVGVTVDKDSLYLMGDYTVTHNCGKSRVAVCLGRWLEATGRGTTQIITPSNLLVKQYEEEFSELRVLHRKDNYRCKRSSHLTCQKQLLKKNLGSYCGDCRLTNAKRQYVEGPISLANTYLYKAHKVYKPNLIIDEAHTVVDFIRDMRAKVKWRDELDYPNVTTYGELVGWLRTKPGMAEFLEECGFNDSPKYLIQPTRELRGRGYNRRYEDCLKFLPLDVSKAPPYLWPPKHVRKVVLMSATIGAKDIEYLGLNRRRVYTIKCLSPILAERRPVIYEPIGSMSHATQVANLPRLAAKIRELLARHPHEKGVVHLTYSLAARLRPLLSDEPRLIWHNKYDKQEQFRRFKQGRPEDGGVLMASGLYEGIDLPHDDGRWQLLAKVPWPSLADPLINYLAEQDEEYYHWETLKLVLQACGRICRRLDDYGITYISDTSFRRLYDNARKLMPDYFLDSLEIS